MLYHKCTTGYTTLSGNPLSLTYRIHMIMFYMTLLSSMVGDSWGCVLLYRELFVSARGDDSASWPVVKHFVFHLNEQPVGVVDQM